MSTRKLTEEVIQEMITLRENSVPYHAIADLFGVSTSTVCVELRARGVVKPSLVKKARKRSDPLQEEVLDQMITLRQNGGTYSAIAEALGTSVSVVSDELRARQIKRTHNPRPHPQNQQRLEEIYALRLQGLTLEKIGERHGICRERVRQILRTHPEYTPAPRHRNILTPVQKNQKALQKPLLARQEQMKVRMLSAQGLTQAEIVRRTGLGANKVSALLNPKNW
jgi:DNA invertase Pin-like site-specific DNA recombinase